MSDELIFLSRQTIPPAYVIEDLGLLREGRISHATSINRAGDVVGEADTDPGGMHAFLYADGEMTDLGVAGAVRTVAVDINDQRQVVGLIERHGEGPSPFLWQDGRLIDLAAHDLKDVRSVCGINNDCAIVGSQSVVQGAGDDDLQAEGEAAFLWQPGRLIRITDLPIRWSEAFAVSDGGFVAGEIYEPGLDRAHAFVWKRGSLVVFGAGCALDVNDHGVVAGYAALSASAANACIWSENVRRDIPMPRGMTYSKAVAINECGEVVGQMGRSANETAPFLWSHEHLIDLNDTIDPRSGWKLQEAADINDAGQIAGWGFRGHRHHAFRMTPNRAG